MQATALRRGGNTSTKTTTTTTCMKQQFNKKGKGKEKKTAGLNYETWGIFTNPICIYFRRT